VASKLRLCFEMTTRRASPAFGLKESNRVALGLQEIFCVVQVLSGLCDLRSSSSSWLFR
jgi:hypothetical protein